MTSAPRRFLWIPVPAGLRALLEQSAVQWQRLSARERLGVQLALIALATLAVVAVGLTPALRTLKQAPIQQAQLRAQLQVMQTQAAEALALRDQPPVTAEQAQQALKAATERLGNGSTLDLQGPQARVSLREVEGETLRRYLLEIRSSARARPLEAQLQRGPRGYNGSLLLQLGSAP